MIKQSKNVLKTQRDIQKLRQDGLRTIEGHIEHPRRGNYLKYHPVGRVRLFLLFHGRRHPSHSIKENAWSFDGHYKRSLPPCGTEMVSKTVCWKKKKHGQNSSETFP